MSVAPARLAQLLLEPHHDGCELHVARAARRARRRRGRPCSAPRAARADRVLLRYARDGEPRTVEAIVDEETEHETWWRATFPVANPATRYRWLLTGGDDRLRLADRQRRLEPRGAVERRLRDVARRAARTGTSRRSSTRSSPTASRRRAPSARRPTGPCRAPGTSCRPAAGRRRRASGTAATCAGIEQHLDHIESLGANAVYLTPIFPARLDPPLRREQFEHVDPLLGGDEALASLARAARRARDQAARRPDAQPHRPRARVVHGGAGRADAPERGFYYFDDVAAERLRVVARRAVAAEARLAQRRAAPADAARSSRSWLDVGLAGWRIDVANMTGRYRDDRPQPRRRRAGRAQPAGGALWSPSTATTSAPTSTARGWHGVMNYAGFLRPIWWWLARRRDRDQTSSRSAPAPRYDGARVVSRDAALPRRRARGRRSLHSWTLLDSPRHRALPHGRRRLARPAPRRRRPADDDARRADDLRRRRARARGRLGRGRAPDDAVGSTPSAGTAAARQTTARSRACGARATRSRAAASATSTSPTTRSPTCARRAASGCSASPRAPSHDADLDAVHESRDALRRRRARRRAPVTRSRIPHLENWVSSHG